MNFFLGCAVWAYKGWVGEFYPPGTRLEDFLNLYSRRFTSVEGNTTFYAVPSEDTVARWVAETPPDFKFCLKFPRDVTHNGRLKPYIPGALSFIEVVRGLGERLGCIFVQLPPIYDATLLNDLTMFLEALPRTEVPVAVEVRHRDWFGEPHASRLTAVLEKLGVGRVLLDSRPVYAGGYDPQLHAERRKPKVPVQFSVTAPFSVVRFISHPNLEVNQPFMMEWVNKIPHWLQDGKQVYFFVHCPVEERSPRNARYFQSLLEQSGVKVPPLPWNNLEQPPNQLNLW